MQLCFDRSLFNTLSMVYQGYVGEYASVLRSVSVYYFIYSLSRLCRRIQVFCDLSLFTNLSMTSPSPINIFSDYTKKCVRLLEENLAT